MKILILGGNRFFGKKLAQILIDKLYDVTLLNRGNVDDGFGNRVNRIKCDRSNKADFKAQISKENWDLVYDQICFDYDQAKVICEALNGKTQKLIFTSSQSVYDYGEHLVEEDFQTSAYQLKEFVKKEDNYAEAKRQAEVAFDKYATFPVIQIRFPIVIGEDDYTERFQFHVDRIKEGRPIYFPNIKAKMSFVTSDFAAEALAFFAEQDFSGPVNIASSKAISLERFIEIIENDLNKPANIIQQESSKDHSPYGIEKDWFMNCDKLSSLGLSTEEVEQWLPKLLLKLKD